MGNQIPESHNQSSETTSEIKPIIESIVTDLVNAVHIRESIMSESPEPDFKMTDPGDLDGTSYFEASESLPTPFDCPNEANFISNQTLIPNTANDFMDLSRDGIDEENDYSPKKSGGSTSVSDWKYSTYSSPNKEYTNPYSPSSVGSKYNDILDSWNLNKNDNKLVQGPKSKTYPSRASLMRNFDPLFGTEDTFPSPPERRKAKQRVEKSFFNEFNDSTGLIEHFAKCKIEESAESEETTPTPVTNPKPDVLDFTVQQQKDNDLTDKITELENELKEKNSKLEEISQLLDKSNEEKKGVIQLVETLHDVNQELFRCSLEKLDSMQKELTDAHKEKRENEEKFFESKVICDKLMNELSSLQMTISANENQYSMTIERMKQLEDKCNHLMARNASLEKQISAVDNKKDFENEIITYKVQNKRMEMKVKSLENQLDQKNKENIELSSMVDELIVKVHK